MLRSRFVPPGFGLVAALGMMVLALAVGCAPAAAPPAPTAAPAPPKAAPAAPPAPTAASAPKPAASAPTELVFATWSSFPPILKGPVEKFEKDTGIKVQYSVGSTGDRLTKLNAEKGKPSIDVAWVPPDDALKLMAADVIEPPNMSLPNVKDLYEVARHPGGHVSSLLAIGLAYNPTKGKPTSWLDMWDPKYKGKVALSAWPGSPATVQLVMAARLHGGNDDNLGPGFEALKKLLPVKFFATGPAAEPFYAQGDTWIHPAIHGAVIQMKKKGVPIDWVAPKEGAAADFNVMVVPKGVKNKVAAEKFVDFILGAEVQLTLAKQIFYGPVNKTVQIPADLAADIHPTPEEQKNLQSIPWEKISKQQAGLSERWNKEIAGR